MEAFEFGIRAQLTFEMDHYENSNGLIQLGTKTNEKKLLHIKKEKWKNGKKEK
jgi:hypothetical protein